MNTYLSIYPIIFLESLFSLFILPKYIQLSCEYGTSLTGGLLIGLYSIELLPQYHTTYDYYIQFGTMFVLFAAEFYIERRNKIKHISLWMNSLKYIIYGFLSGLCVYEYNMEFFISILISNFTTSYTLGHRYIEYISDFKDKIPLILYVLSIPFGYFLNSHIDISFLGLVNLYNSSSKSSFKCSIISSILNALSLPSFLIKL